MTTRTSVAPLICAAAIAVFPAIANAQPTAHTTAPFSMPDLHTPRLLGVELAYMRLAYDSILAEQSLHLVNLDVYGQAEIMPGMFLFGRLPVSYIDGDDPDEQESDLGNLLLGARLLGGKKTYGISVAVGLPTAPERRDFITDDGGAAFGSAEARYDLYDRYMSDTTSISVHGHLRRDGDKGFAQAQLGYERLYTDGEAIDQVRLAASVGYKTPEHLVLIAELTNIIREESDQEWLFHWLRLGARYETCPLQFGAHIYLALDTPVLDRPGTPIELRFPGLVFDMATTF